MNSWIRNGKSEFMPIRMAKELCREVHGQLPRCGYEMLVAGGTVFDWLTMVNGRNFFSHWPIEFWLVNESGRFRVRESWDTLGEYYQIGVSLREE